MMGVALVYLFLMFSQSHQKHETPQAAATGRSQLVVGFVMGTVISVFAISHFVQPTRTSSPLVVVLGAGLGALLAYFAAKKMRSR